MILLAVLPWFVLLSTLVVVVVVVVGGGGGGGGLFIFGYAEGTKFTSKNKQHETTITNSKDKTTVWSWWVHHVIQSMPLLVAVGVLCLLVFAHGTSNTTSHNFNEMTTMRTAENSNDSNNNSKYCNWQRRTNSWRRWLGCWWCWR